MRVAERCATGRRHQPVVVHFKARGARANHHGARGCCRSNRWRDGRSARSRARSSTTTSLQIPERPGRDSRRETSGAECSSSRQERSSRVFHRFINYLQTQPRLRMNPSTHEHLHANRHYGPTDGPSVPAVPGNAAPTTTSTPG